MSKSRDKMIAVLKEEVVPVLREKGFRGTYPHFRRSKESWIDLLSFQFNRHGGSFVVEAAICPTDGIRQSSGNLIPPEKVEVGYLRERLRLGSHPPRKVDHWFSFSGWSLIDDPCRRAAKEVLACLPQAEDYWSRKKDAYQIAAPNREPAAGSR